MTLQVDGALAALGTPGSRVTIATSATDPADPATDFFGALVFSPASTAAAVSVAGDWVTGCALVYTDVGFGGAGAPGEQAPSGLTCSHLCPFHCASSRQAWSA